MKKNIIAAVFTVFVGILLFSLEGCDTPVEDTSVEDQIREDSLAQASKDSIVIVDYLEDNGLISSEGTVLDYGITYFMTNPTEDTKIYGPNDLVSMHLTSMFENNQIFTTSDRDLAIETDSLAWVSRWKEEAGSGTPQSFLNDTLYIGSTPQDSVFTDGKSIGDVLTELSDTKEPLDYLLYSNVRPYNPQVINYTVSGSELAFSWPFGLRFALTDAMPKMRLGSSVKVLCPSAVLYGNVGSGAIPPNTVVIYQIDIVAVRP